MRHVFQRCLSLSIPVLPCSVVFFALLGALVDGGSSFERFTPGDDPAGAARAVQPAPITLAAHDIRCPAQLAVKQSP